MEKAVVSWPRISLPLTRSITATWTLQVWFSSTLTTSEGSYLKLLPGSRYRPKQWVDAKRQTHWQRATGQKHATVSSMVQRIEQALADLRLYSSRSKQSCCVLLWTNRGAGCFLGDVQLKSLIQWAAASQAGLSMCYFPWDDRYMAERLQPLTYALAALVNVSLSACVTAVTAGSSVFLVVGQRGSSREGDYCW